MKRCCSSSGPDFFLIGQNILVTNNVAYQDNQSAMLLENNGKMSSSKCNCHLVICYFFAMDNIHKKHLWVEYCLTNDMIGDFFTKPLQGAKFQSFRDLILGCRSGDVPGKI
jgi:hypothetical protein